MTMAGLNSQHLAHVEPVPQGQSSKFEVAMLVGCTPCKDCQTRFYIGGRQLKGLQSAYTPSMYRNISRLRLLHLEKKLSIA